MIKHFNWLGIIFISFVLTSCQSNKKDSLHSSASPKSIGMPNPASVYCIQLKGKLIIQRNNLGEYGECKLPNGQVIDEWDLYRRDHSVDNRKNK